MYEVLRSEGLTDLEFVVITMQGPTWEYHASGYDKATFPIEPDTDGVFYIYGATAYDVILIDKKGRLVSKQAGFDDTDTAMVSKLNQRMRELYAE
jgi:hypothetical protein